MTNPETPNIRIIGPSHTRGPVDDKPCSNPCSACPSKKSRAPGGGEGYARNAIVYRAVRLIAESIGGVSFVLYEGAAERDAHPLIDLIARPNPR
jgi:hypothetical protein